MITLYQSNIICCALRYLQVQKKMSNGFFAILGLFQDSTKTSFVEVYFFFFVFQRKYSIFVYDEKMHLVDIWIIKYLNTWIRDLMCFQVVIILFLW